MVLELAGTRNPIADLDLVGAPAMRADDADQSAAFSMPGAEKYFAYAVGPADQALRVSMCERIGKEGDRGSDRGIVGETLQGGDVSDAQWTQNQPRRSTRGMSADTGFYGHASLRIRCALHRCLSLTIVRATGRAVAQPGSASAWGAEGREFESRLPDHFFSTFCERVGAGAPGGHAEKTGARRAPGAYEVSPAAFPGSALSERIAVAISVETENFGVTASAASRPWVFVAALATVFMTAIEGTIVATAMPTIVGTLGNFELFSWVFTSYLLTQAVTIPIYGRLADLVGRKRILFVGIGVFLFGSVCCGFAWSMIALVAFRVIQGIGAGAIMPVGRTLVGDLYHGAERARMQAYVSTVFASAAIFGPMVGAFIVAHANWRMVFWVNVPLGILAAILLAVTLREHVQPRRHRIDYLGSVLMTLGIGMLMFALVQAARLSISEFVALLAVSLLLLTIFMFHQRHVPEPMLPSSLWRDRMISAGNVASIASGASMMGITAFLPAFIQDVMGYPPLVGGLALTAMSGGWPLGGYFGGQIMLRFTYRVTAVTGGFIFVAGSLMMIDLTAARGPLWAIVSAFFVGLGMGLTNNCFLVAIQNGAEWSQRGIATSSMVFTRILGQSVGAAAFGGILNAALASAVSGGGDLVTRLLEPTMRGSIPAADLAPIMAAFDLGLHRVYLIIGALALVVLACSVLLPAGLNPLRPRRQ